MLQNMNFVLNTIRLQYVLRKQVIRQILRCVLLAGLFCLLSYSTVVQASERTSENSAQIDVIIGNEEENSSNFAKRIAIKKVLEKYQSPLTTSAGAFVKACEMYELDCYLLPSISGLESTFGKFIYPNSFNPFGWGRGYILFESWEDGILTTAKGLKEGYVDRGASTLEEIGSIYSESETWAIRVNYFMRLFAQEEKKVDLFLKSI